ncbi:DNA-directed RNA polymerase II subunit rpb1-like [Penaeus japonicus]|uniref:DNA-directed RNA polymerase II subunit rpb1-like n=1 Tax=Penaeus japonicus TaxID=27405 RepID=UPI001C714AD9|nr:DNA-directed RNA polymerase II subunit rpb1-like [Penaeus japonicus]
MHPNCPELKSPVRPKTASKDNFIFDADIAPRIQLLNDWDRYLPSVLFVHRGNPYDALRCSPFELLCGRRESETKGAGLLTQTEAAARRLLLPVVGRTRTPIQLHLANYGGFGRRSVRLAALAVTLYIQVCLVLSSPSGLYHQIPARYAFTYDVKDDYSGNDFGHQESRHGHTASGQYRVLLPDGRTQVVTYTADETGYHPVITYEGPASFPYKAEPVHRPVRPAYVTNTASYRPVPHSASPAPAPYKHISPSPTTPPSYKPYIPTSAPYYIKPAPYKPTITPYKPLYIEEPQTTKPATTTTTRKPHPHRPSSPVPKPAHSPYRPPHRSSHTPRPHGPHSGTYFPQPSQRPSRYPYRKKYT